MSQPRIVKQMHSDANRQNSPKRKAYETPKKSSKNQVGHITENPGKWKRVANLMDMDKQRRIDAIDDDSYIK